MPVNWTKTCWYNRFGDAKPCLQRATHVSPAEDGVSEEWRIRFCEEHKLPHQIPLAEEVRYAS